jgi:hypothetical protein
MYSGTHRWLKLYKAVQQKPVWVMPPLYFKIWLWILMNADDETGQIQTSLDKIASDVAWDARQNYKKPSKPTVKRALHELEIVDSITTEVVYRSFTRITVTNWSQYQQPKADGLQEKSQVALHEKLNIREEKIREEKKKNKDTDKDFPSLWKFFREKIKPNGKDTAPIRKRALIKIIARKSSGFTGEELMTALVNFSKDKWQMENNAHRGLDWILDKDQRVDQFLNPNDAQVEEKAEQRKIRERENTRLNKERHAWKQQMEQDPMTQILGQ